MPSRQFPLDDTLNHLVQLQWQPFWRTLTVTLNGDLLHTFPSKEALEEGRKFDLEDGRQFSVRLRGGELETRLEGLLVEDSESATAPLWRAMRPAFLAGSLAMLFGLIRVLVRDPENRYEDSVWWNFNTGVFLLCFGLAVIGAGIWYSKRRSAPALILLLALFAATSLIAWGQTGNFIVSLILVFFAVLLFPGFRVLRALKQRDNLNKIIETVREIGE